MYQAWYIDILFKVLIILQAFGCRVSPSIIHFRAAQADLSDDRYFSNDGTVRSVGNVRDFDNFRNVRRDRQTPSVIHFWNNKLELICISGMVGM